LSNADIEVTVPTKATEVILYCGGGYRSALRRRFAADGLHECLVDGRGWKAWKESGAPVEQ